MMLDLNADVIDHLIVGKFSLDKNIFFETGHSSRTGVLLIKCLHHHKLPTLI